MDKEAKDFQEKAKELGVKKWDIHDCGMCGYMCGFRIYDDEVYYDSGCGCSWDGERLSSWEEIAELYNMNAGAKDAQERTLKYPKFANTIREANALWGFENPDWLLPAAEALPPDPSL